MDTERLKLIIRNMELLLDSLKAEIYSDIPQYKYDDIKPEEIDYDEVFYLMSVRAKKLVKLLERLIRQDHLYSNEELKKMKSQLRVVKEELAELEAKTSKGFGK